MARIGLAKRRDVTVVQLPSEPVQEQPVGLVDLQAAAAHLRSRIVGRGWRLAIGTAVVTGAIEPFLLRRLPFPLAVSALAFIVALFLLVSLAAHDRWAAREALAWYGRRQAARWEADVGGPPPKPSAVDAWLADHPAGSVPTRVRIAVLVNAGRTREAAELMMGLPMESTTDRGRSAWLHAAIDLVDGRAVDLEGLISTMVEIEDEGERTYQLVNLAYWQAVLADRSGGDWRAPIARASSVVEGGQPARSDRLRALLDRYLPVALFLSSAAICHVVLSVITRLTS